MRRGGYDAKITNDKEKEIYPDCAGFEKMKNRCARKTGTVNCIGCKLYESKEDYNKKLVKCAKRLMSLPAEQQDYICDKYNQKRSQWTYIIATKGEKE